jgi:hypothetical protein
MGECISLNQLGVMESAWRFVLCYYYYYGIAITRIVYVPQDDSDSRILDHSIARNVYLSMTTIRA